MEIRAVCIGALVICCLLPQGCRHGNPYITDYNYNTVFARAPYADKKLSSIDQGSTREQVVKTLGTPLYVEDIDFLHCMLFSQANYRIDPLAAKYHGIDSSCVKDDSAPFIAFWFSEDGKVDHVFNQSRVTSDQVNELLGLDTASITNRFGTPKEEILVQPCYFFSYSKLKEGPYYGTEQGIYIRRIYFNKQDRVIGIESSKGPQYDIYNEILGNKSSE